MHCHSIQHFRDFRDSDGQNVGSSVSESVWNIVPNSDGAHSPHSVHIDGHTANPIHWPFAENDRNVLDLPHWHHAQFSVIGMQRDRPDAVHCDDPRFCPNSFAKNEHSICAAER